MDLCKHCGQKIVMGPDGWVHPVDTVEGTHAFMFCDNSLNRAEPQSQGE